MGAAFGARGPRAAQRLNLTLRRLLLHVGAGQVAVHQGRLAAGQVPHDALAERRVSAAPRGDPSPVLQPPPTTGSRRDLISQPTHPHPQALELLEQKNEGRARPRSGHSCTRRAPGRGPAVPAAAPSPAGLSVLPAGHTCCDPSLSWEVRRALGCSTSGSVWATLQISCRRSTAARAAPAGQPCSS